MVGRYEGGAPNDDFSNMGTGSQAGGLKNKTPQEEAMHIIFTSSGMHNIKVMHMNPEDVESEGIDKVNKTFAETVQQQKKDMDEDQRKLEKKQDKKIK